MYSIRDYRRGSNLVVILYSDLGIDFLNTVKYFLDKESVYEKNNLYVSCIGTDFFLSHVFFPAYGYSEQTSAGNQDYIPMDIVAEASCYVESDAAGNQFVVLTYVNDVTLSKTGDRRNYEATTLAILAESDAERERLIQDIMRIKQSGSANRATGSYSDEKWYHSSSLCIEGTVYYSTVDSAGITYGKITDVYVQCNVVNSTVLDGISFVVGQYGYTLEGDAPRVYEVTKNNVGNRSTTSVSEELPYIKWDDTSFANACISATIHRGTSSQYTYTFYVPALGEVYNG